MVISCICFVRCHSAHSIFVHNTKSGSVILTVYVDDLLLNESDFITLVEIKEYLKLHFVTKNMGKPKYFLGIEVAYKNMSYFCLR